MDKATSEKGKDKVITIIVPIYNKEKYLHRCIDSITTQTYSDIELILVDDGSTDNSVGICDEYAEKDARIRVIHKVNGGVSSARNAGIEAASGEYLTFVDGDDYIEKTMLESIAEAIEKEKVDIVFIREKSVNQEGKTIRIAGSCATGAISYGPQENAAEIIIGRQCNGMCDKTYRRDLIGDLRVIERMYHGEDLLFNIQILCRVQRMAYVDRVLYSYVSNDDSITHEKFNTHTIDGLFFKDEAARLIAVSFPEYSALAMRRSFVARLNIARQLRLEKLEAVESELSDEINAYMRAQYPVIKRSLSLVERTEYLIYQYANALYTAFLATIKLVKRVKER